MSLGSYFLGVVSFSVAVNLIGMLYPNDKSGVRRAIDICSSLCLLCVVIAPIGGIISEAKKDISLDDIIFDMSESDVEVNSALVTALENESELEIEDKLYRLLSARFDVKDIEIDVSVSVDESGVAINYIKVYLYGSGILTDPRDIKAEVAKYTDAECIIIEGRK